MGVSVAVVRQADEVRELGHAPLEAVERRIGQRGRHLPGAVGAEVHEDDDVSILHRRAVANDRRRYKFVVFAARVGGFKRTGCRGLKVLGRSLHDGVIGRCDALPALVAIHREETTGNRGDLRAGFGTHRFHRGDGRRSTAWWHVATVEKSVNRDVRHVATRRKPDHRLHVALVRVHAAGREQAQDMELAARLHCRIARAYERRIGHKLARLNGVVYARQVLVHHAASAKIQMPDLGIAKLSFWQADVLLGSINQAVRAIAPERVPDGLLRERNGIVRRRLAITEAVEDDEDDRANGRGCGRGSWGGHFRHLEAKRLKF